MENASNLFPSLFESNCKTFNGCGWLWFPIRYPMPYCHHVGSFIIYPVLPFYPKCAYEGKQTMMKLSSISQSV